MKNWLIAYLQVPFRMIAWVIGIFLANRAQQDKFVERFRLRDVFNWLIVITVFAWLAVWLFMGTERRDDLTNAIKEGFTSFSTSAPSE